MPERDGGHLLVWHAEDEEEAGASRLEAASAEAAEPVAAVDERAPEQAALGDKTDASHANGHPQASGETRAYIESQIAGRAASTSWRGASHLMALCFCPLFVRTMPQQCYHGDFHRG